jgi:hypothetical protein
LNAVVTGLEGPPGALLPNIEKIAANLFLAQIFRRPVAVMLHQGADRLEINLLGLGGQAGQLHLLDHSPPQWCHRLLLAP